MLYYVCCRCWGKGFAGQLGDEQYQARGKYPGEMGSGVTAVNLGTNATVVTIAAGHDHSCSLLGDGSLKVLINNNNLTIIY